MSVEADPFVVGMGEFARLEARLRAQKVALSPPAPPIPVVPPPPAPADPFSAGMDAFARLEAKLRADKAAAGTPVSPVDAAQEEPLPTLRDDPKPQPPDPYECCGNSCDNCVWTVYWEALEDWERREKRRAARGDL